MTGGFGISDGTSDGITNCNGFMSMKSNSFSENSTSLETATLPVWGWKIRYIPLSDVYPTKIPFIDFDSSFVRNFPGICRHATHPNVRKCPYLGALPVNASNGVTFSNARVGKRFLVQQAACTASPQRTAGMSWSCNMARAISTRVRFILSETPLDCGECGAVI